MPCSVYAAAHEPLLRATRLTPCRHTLLRASRRCLRAFDACRYAADDDMSISPRRERHDD